MFCGNTLMDIFTQTWFVLYLFSEMKHWAYLYINSLLIRDLFLLSCVYMIMYDLCDYHTHILAFISEMRTVVLHRFITVIFFKMSDAFYLHSLFKKRNVCRSNSTLVQHDAYFSTQYFIKASGLNSVPYSKDVVQFLRNTLEWIPKCKRRYRSVAIYSFSPHQFLGA